VTVVDDGHVTATAPAGSGTVDVRVQSGVSDPSDPSNVNSPIFGYGISSATAADQFTYGTGGTTNQPPTVAVPASASPNPVGGTTTALSVLGADDGGEANLTYTWTVVSAPSGTAPAFSANGSNAAKNTTVTFGQAGSYLFQVTITDAGGLSTTSRVAVTVNQRLTSVVVTPASAVVAPGHSVQLRAAARDQFGHALAAPPVFAWAVVSGKGTVSSTGLYKAPSKWQGTATVRASAGGVSGTAVITVRAGARQPALHRAARHRPARRVQLGDRLPANL
jgi:hypothetical protein